MDTSIIFKEIAENIERFVHQDSDRAVLMSIFDGMVALAGENEQLKKNCDYLKEDNANLRINLARLDVYERLYQDYISLYREARVAPMNFNN